MEHAPQTPDTEPSGPFRRFRSRLWWLSALLALAVMSLVIILNWQLGPERFAQLLDNLRPWLLAWKAGLLAAAIVFWQPVCNRVGRHYGFGPEAMSALQATRLPFILFVIVNESAQILLRHG